MAKSYKKYFIDLKMDVAYSYNIKSNENNRTATIQQSEILVSDEHVVD